MTRGISKIRSETRKGVELSALLLILFLLYSALRIVTFPAFEEVRSFPDTPVYTELASQTIWDLHFWVGPRPWTTSLFYKLLRIDPQRIAKFQLAFSTICWGLLALCVARTLRSSWLGPIAFTMILVFSLSAEIIMWDGVILSDSISLSLMALFIASWLWLVEDWQWFKVALLTLAAFLWSFAKDTNAWVVLMIAALIIIAVVARRIQGRYVLIASVFALIFAMNDVSANRAHRWVVAFMNIVGLRILLSPERTAYFAELGMPVTPALMQRREKKAWTDNWAFFKDPGLQNFRDWLHADGKASYIRFLLAHPAMTTQEPLRHPEELLAPELKNYAPVNFSPILSGALAEIVYVKIWGLLLIWAAGIVVGLVVGLGLWKHRKAVIVSLALIVLAYPHAVLVWHGDPNEIGRHALQAGVHFRLGLWLLLMMAADISIARLSRTNIVNSREGPD